MPLLLQSTDSAARWRMLPLPADNDLAATNLVLRLNALGSLYFFSKFVLRRNRLVEHLHGPIASSLESRHLHYLLELPRDHLKTTMCTESLPIWWSLPFNERDEAAMRAIGYGDEWIEWMRWAHNPQIRTLVISEAGHNAAMLGRRIDQHFQSNPLFINLFPEIIPDEKSIWNNESKHVKHTAFHAHGEGTFDFIGVGGALQSRHYDRMIEDDLVGKEAARSEIIMEDTINYHKLLEGAFDGPDHVQLIVGNRWGVYDLNGWIRENDPDFVIETHSALGGCCTSHDPGVPIFPEEFTVARLERIRRVQGPNIFCLPDEAPILMSDLSERSIARISVGEEVVGYRTGERYLYLRRAIVTAKCEMMASTMRVVTESGREFICTSNHNWLMFTRWYHKRTPFLYLPARVGKKLVSIWNRSGWTADRNVKDRIVSIEPCDEHRVWGMETTTGNYIAYGYASQNSHQYLNQAVRPEEIIFRPEWVRYYSAKAEPFMRKVFIEKENKAVSVSSERMSLTHEPREGEVMRDISVSALTRSMVVDPNHSGSQGRARHAILITGLDPETDRIYLLDLWAQSMPYDDLMANVYRMADRWRLSEFWLETVAAQKYLKYHIEYRNKIEKRTLRVRDLRTDRSKNAKWTRIDALSPLFEQGKIFVRRDQSAFLDEYFRYAHSTKYTVDVLDCLGYASQTWSAISTKGWGDDVERRKHRFFKRRGIMGY